MVIRDLLLAVGSASGMEIVITGVGTYCVIIACGLCLVSRFFQSRFGVLGHYSFRCCCFANVAVF